MVRFLLRVLTAMAVIAGLFVSSAGAVQSPQGQLVSAQPTTATPQVLDGIVMAIAELNGGTATEADDRIVLGGSFTRATNYSGGTQFTRSSILAFNKLSGAIDTTFAPQFNGTVRSLLPSPDGKSVYVGGQFSQVTIGGSTVGASKLVRLDWQTGQRISAFAAGTIDGVVYDVKFSHGRLVVAGGFATIKSQPRRMLAALDPTTGTLLPDVNFNVAGTHNGGNTEVVKIDVTPDGNTLIAIGNFRTVNDQARVQVAMIDLSSATATLADWHTAAYEPMCYSSFERYANDVDFAPDGSYFVITTWGGYGSGPPTLCDTATRWETGARGSGLQPTWATYTGGDSLYAVAVTNAAVYVGGHNRWLNNPFAADALGAGGVTRQGIGALDPSNGVPLSWNPGRDRGRGVFDLLATSTHLYVGSDTDRIANGQYRARIASFPLIGGKTVPQPSATVLPVDVNMLSPISSAPAPTTSRYLHRVNAAGGSLSSVDQGPAWTTDAGLVAGGNTAGYDAVGGISPQVDAATTPLGVFSSERWGPQDWALPVAAGKQVQVRLFFANRYDGTSGVGSRVFDVLIDGATVLDDYDIVADAGHNTGTMKSFTITSDGEVNIDLRAVVENPLINGIEIIDPSVAPPAPPAASRYVFRGVGGSSGVLSVDEGPDWTNGAGVVSGGNLASYNAVGSVAGTIDRDTVPLAIFSGERWGAHQWRIPATAGKNLQVKLYFANRYDGTAQPGTRVFDVRIDGTTVLDDYDIVADVGHNTGTVKTFNITSDGFIDISFSNVVENPLVNGVEVIDPSIPVTADGAANSISRRSFDGATVGGTSSPGTGGIQWSKARGSFVADGQLYTAWANGTWTKRSYNGTTFGAATTLNLNGLGDAAVEAQAMTGLFYDQGYMYFTQAGDQQLYRRAISVESGIIGAQRTVVANAGSGINFANVRGTFLVGGNLYWASTTDGTLHRSAWSSGRPVAGSDTVVSGPAQDGNDWRARALFATGGSAPNKAPTAAFSVDCTGTTCSFDGTGSSDTDGSVQSWTWEFGDGGTATGSKVTRAYATPGERQVVLRVADNAGATGTTAQQVITSNALPVADFTADCSGLTCSLNGGVSSDPDGTVSAWSWQFGNNTTGSGVSTTASYTSAATYSVTLTVTDNRGATASVTKPVTVASAAMQLVGSSTNGVGNSATAHTTTLPAAVRAGDVLVAYLSTNAATATATAPAGWTVRADRATTAARAFIWTKVATAADAGASVSFGTSAVVKGSLNIAAYRGAVVDQVNLVGEAASSATHSAPAVNVPNGSTVLWYYTDKTAATTNWTGPAGSTVLQTGAGTGAGHLSWLLAASSSPRTGNVPAQPATADSATANALMATVVLAPQ